MFIPNLGAGEICSRTPANSNLQGMEDLIFQAFLHVDFIGQHVQDGHYDLMGPNGEIILPQVWDAVVQPGMAITMHMWPMQEPPEDRLPSSSAAGTPLHPLSLNNSNTVSEQCSHNFRTIKSHSTTDLWHCSVCHSGPHWLIYDCQHCNMKTCRPCSIKQTV